MLQSAQSASQDGWTMIVSADGANAAPGNSYDIRGRLDLTSISASTQFFSKQVTGETTSTTYVLSTRSNGLYYWPLPGAQSLSRDGTFNIGVDIANQNTESRFKIQVFSGSSASNPQTYHIKKAIEVTYGSGSTINTTVCVSSSGQVIATGYSGSNFNAVSFYGSASYSNNALSSSYALTSSNSNTSSYALTASYLTGTNSLGILTQTSPNAASTYKGTSYTYTHLLGSTPYYFRSVLICTSNDVTAGYIVNDEIEAVSVYDSSTDNEHTAITSWTNPYYLGASCLNNGWLVNKKSDGSGVALDPSLWKIKFYYR
jgi:hypothetical protein